MVADKTILPGSLKLTPLTQGSLDGLCCLYSIINGIRVALYPDVELRRGVVHQLFAEGIAVLAKSRFLPGTVTGGMVEQTWMRLCDSIITRAATVTGTNLNRSPILRGHHSLDTRKCLRLIKNELRAGRPVLLCLSGCLSHCTLAVGYTRQRILLFDSSGHRWISVNCTGLHHARSTKRHQLARTSAQSLAISPQVW